ncbi:MAG: hypothetical protein AMXMBFR77_20260 [Phycisphaerales bacterium]|nr:MAG: hypothetical protein BroJett004_18560 [Planctomycetota bacterium]
MAGAYHAGMVRGVMVALAGFAAIGAGCSRTDPFAEKPADAPPETVHAAEARAEKAADSLARALIAELQQAMGDGGAARALDVCRDAAESIRAEVSANEGVDVRRTALRVRNPANAPDEWERATLESWASGAAAPGPVSRVVQTGGATELRWMRPIVLIDLCVHCHGTTERLAAGVPEALARFYPYDQATGFEVGDLRGAFSVRIPLD